MASEPPIEAPDAAAAPEVAPAAEPVASPPPSTPVSRIKEWAVAVAIMIVFAIICAPFIMFLRSNQYGGIGP
jgi:hypothetical protein